MHNTDLIIIGAGPGGYETAVHAAKSGLSVVVIEAQHLGGTCLNAGCIPTKCLAHSAELLEAARTGADIGVNVMDVNFDLAQAVAHKNSVVGQLTAGIEALMKTPAITLVTGKAHFAAPGVVVVGDEEYAAKNIIIATGSSAKFLPVEGATLPGVITSTELLNLTALPQRLCIIGGGVIGMEFASIFNAFGTEVTVVEYCKEVLPNMDKDLAKRLRMMLKKRGVAFHTGCGVQCISQLENGSYAVAGDAGGKTVTVETDLVLMAVGRQPNFDGLGLEAAGIEFSPRGIAVDENLCTNVPGVYAIGDVTGLCPLAHAATFQGRRALNHILGKADTINFNLVPAAVFTSPQLASVGLREEDCGEEKPVVYKSFYRANGRALTMGASEGMLKIVTNAEGRILGVHILGEQAAELVHEATALIKQGATVADLDNIIHAHPTLSELYLSAIG